MTDEETLESTEKRAWVGEQGASYAAIPVAVARSLIADSRDLRELVAALPKCMDDNPCDATATMLWRFDAPRSPEEFYCDRHGPLWMIDLGSKLELPYASVLRRMGRGA